MKNMSDIILVTGAAASGKSELAEQICCGYGGRRLYIATMRPYGEDGAARVQKHRAMRAGRGFDTVECYGRLERLKLYSPPAIALLEDTGNLVANLLYGESSCTVEEILAGVFSLAECVPVLVVVANEVFCGIEQPAMELYLHMLAELHRGIAARASAVMEAICGLPHILYGKL